jgi:membrane protease YdiL (CAAX protease family)
MFRLLAALSLFISAYVASVALAAALMRLAGLPLMQWAWLFGGVTATVLTIATAERGHWQLGLSGPPRRAASELLLGGAFAAVLILAADGLVLATTSLHHLWRGLFPWRELLAVYVPAAVHEELVFRGYPYQRLRTLGRGPAIAVSSLVFAALHLGNRGITPPAVVNLILGGVLLALAFERYGRLWFPIGLHLTWNLLSGPVLGYDVSGFVPEATLLTARGSGPWWLTGGTFGIEGSVWMALAEVAGIAVLLLNARRISSRTQENE